MQIGDYEVLSTIGQGGMGTVLRARAPGGGEVAVKVLMSQKADRIRRFQRERRLLSKLGRGEGFVPLGDFGDSQLGPYFVMPLLSGGTLCDRIGRGPMGVQPSVELVEQLARAMGRAHAKGIVHRDLKPDNVLFSQDDEPLIADLGLAKYFTDRDAREVSQTQGRLSSTGDARGTWGYMAPEQIRDAKSVGPRADVFALGAILHECVLGEPAFPGSHSLEVLARIHAQEFPVLDGSALPRWLKELLHQCLAVDPKLRPADGAALADALAKSSGSARRRNRWRNRRIAVYVGAALGLAFALAYGDAILGYLHRFKDGHKPAVGGSPGELKVESIGPAPGD
jgi:serine/threonine protein kinase